MDTLFNATELTARSAAAKIGRQSTFTAGLAETICERIATGESLRNVCRSAHMPSKSTVSLWLRNSREFSDQYARACEFRADAIADEIIEIADNCTDPQKARVQIDARKWYAAKIAPKKYGDRITHAGDPENPVQVVTAIRVTYVRPGAAAQ
jgi:hypothetical protein